MEKNLEINLVKEVYKMGTIDDSRVGINSGQYTTFIYRLGGKKEQLIYKYEYELKGRKPYTFIYVDSDYSDIIGILEEKEIIKRY